MTENEEIPVEHRRCKLKGEKQPSIHIMFEQEEIVSGREHLNHLPAYLEN